MRPTNVPTKAPIRNCDSNTTVDYINCISLTNRALTLTGTTAEDKALQWLVTSDPLALTPRSEVNKTRLRQRFALLTVGFQPFYNSMVLSVYQWNLTAVNECNWYKDAAVGFKCDNEQVTNIGAIVTGSLPPDLCWLTAMKQLDISGQGVLNGTLPTQLGWWTNLTSFTIRGGGLIQGTIPLSIGAWTSVTKFSVSSNKLTGNIPSSIGAWTDVKYFDVSFNKLSGSIPPSIGAWKAVTYFNVLNNQLDGAVPSTVAAWTTLQSAFFHTNNLSRTMPTFAGGFCPKKIGNGVTTLTADCKNNTGQAKIVCDCCSTCY
jgi:hypothetical protein